MATTAPSTRKPAAPKAARKRAPRNTGAEPAEKPATRKGPKELTVSHKAALAQGRENAQVVKRYLESIAKQDRRPGRPRSPERIKAEIKALEKRLEGTDDQLVKLRIRQEIFDLQESLKASAAPGPTKEDERAFIRAAATYSERKGIVYQVWRDCGVSPAVLAAAGIKPR